MVPKLYRIFSVIFLCMIFFELSSQDTTRISPSPKSHPTSTPIAMPAVSQVQIRVTFQEPNFRTPWRSKNPSARLALGTYLGENRILVPGSSVAHHTLIEARSLEEVGSKTARLVRMDLESDLAILEVIDPGKLFHGMTAVVFPDEIATKLPVTVWTLGATGEAESMPAKIDSLALGLYPQGRVELPYLEFSSSEKIRGFGELVASKNGKVIGLVQEFLSTTGKGRIIPSQIISTFLKQNQSFAYKGFQYRPIQDATTARYYRLPQGSEGVLVADVFLHSTAYNQLLVEDVLLQVGDFPVDGKGRIAHPRFGKIPFVYLFHAGQEYGYTVGKKIPVKILRDGKIINLKLMLKPFPELTVRIPYGSPRNLTPGYLISGGIVFLELTEFYMQEYGRNWRNSIDKKMLYLLDFHKFRKDENESQRLVYLIQVLPDEGNTGYHDIRHVAVRECNGNPVADLANLHICVAETKPSMFVRFLLDDGAEVILQKSNLNAIDARIQKNFQIPQLYQPATTIHEVESEKPKSTSQGKVPKQGL